MMMSRHTSIDIAYTPDKLLVADLVRDQLEAGKKTRLTITSNSMAPMLCCGDEIDVIAADPAALVAGDIVTLETGDGFLTHRLLECDQNRLITFGDRNRVFDPPFQFDRLLGIVTAIHPASRGKALSLKSLRGQKLNQILFYLSKAKLRLLSKSGSASHANSTRSRVVEILFYFISHTITVAFYV